MITRETIYKRTRTGAVQIWYGELEGNKYRTVSGQIDGKHTISEWTECTGKNIGRSNETTPEEQAAFTLNAMYNKKLEREYRRDIGKIDVKEYTKPQKCLKWYDDIKKRPKKGEKLGIQPKFDGMRCLASIDGCKSQDGIDIPGAPHIVEALQKLMTTVTIDEGDDEVPVELDGELYNHKFKEDFEGLMSALKKEPDTQELLDRAKSVVQYHIYDIVLENTPYKTNDPENPGRYEILQSIFEKYLSEYGDMFQLSPMVEVEMDDNGAVVESVDDDNIENGFEGSIVRVFNNDGYVIGGRPKSAFKVKNFQDDEFPLEDVLEGKGNWSGHAKAIKVLLPNGNICKASVKGNKAYAKQLLEDWRSGKLKKGSMCTVSYLRYSKKGMLNLPIFKSVRWDV